MATSLKASPRLDVFSAIKVAQSLPPDMRLTLDGVSWGDYEDFCAASGEGQNLRIAYDGRSLEIMTTGPLHESLKDWMRVFVHEVTVGLKINCRGLGETTWTRPDVSRGLESDLCFYFDQEKLIACDQEDVRQSNSVADYPNPDLAIEIDLSGSKIDRESIHAALKVSEIWRFHDQSVSIDRLTPSGTYDVAKVSGFLPVSAAEITRWLIAENPRQQVTRTARLRDWIETDLMPRVDASQ